MRSVRGSAPSHRDLHRDYSSKSDDIVQRSLKTGDLKSGGADAQSTQWHAVLIVERDCTTGEGCGVSVKQWTHLSNDIDFQLLSSLAGNAKRFGPIFSRSSTATTGPKRFFSRGKITLCAVRSTTPDPALPWAPGRNGRSTGTGDAERDRERGAGCHGSTPCRGRAYAESDHIALASRLSSRRGVYDPAGSLSGR
jgi:hypothetical protein